MCPFLTFTCSSVPVWGWIVTHSGVGSKEGRVEPRLALHKPPLTPPLPSFCHWRFTAARDSELLVFHVRGGRTSLWWSLWVCWSHSLHPICFPPGLSLHCPWTCLPCSLYSRSGSICPEYLNFLQTLVFSLSLDFMFHVLIYLLYICMYIQSTVLL